MIFSFLTLHCQYVSWFSVKTFDWNQQYLVYTVRASSKTWNQDPDIKTLKTEVPKNQDPNNCSPKNQDPEKLKPQFSLILKFLISLISHDLYLIILPVSSDTYVHEAFASLSQLFYYNNGSFWNKHFKIF